jgi:hypothetical protein
MKARPYQRLAVLEICKEELEAATRRIEERIAEQKPVLNNDDEFASVRRFYEDLAEKQWTEADEQILLTLVESGQNDIKRMMREAFRRSRIYPIPSFGALINSLKRTGEQTAELSVMWVNTDAVSAADRERLANLLYNELGQAVRQIALRLQLTDTKAEILREQLEDVQGQIISRFTPLV